MIRVILCDDHALIRRGIRDTLADEADMRVVGEAGDYTELRGLMRGEACDVLVLDINLPGRNGLDVLHVLKDEGSPVKVLVVSMHPEEQYASQALMRHFTYASEHMDAALVHLQASQLIEPPTIREARLTLATAITALQFQDMATQLIAHTSHRLRNCADRLARDAMGDDEDGIGLVEDTPLRPNPVTQDEMDAGSIELF